MPKSNGDDTSKTTEDPAPPHSEGRAYVIDPQSDEIPFNNPELQELWQGFRVNQRQFVNRRVQCGSDKEAAQELGMSKWTPWSWDDKEEVNRAVELIINEKARAKAKAIDEAAYYAIERLRKIVRHSDNDMAAVKASDTLIEQAMGKAVQKSEIDLDADMDTGDLDAAIDELAEALDEGRD